MIKSYLKNELRLEAAALEKLRSKLAGLPDTVLAIGGDFFYYYVKGRPSKRRYIRKNDMATLRSIAGARYLREKAEVLSNNISVIEKALRDLRDYDDQAILDALPKTYVSAIELVRSASSNEVFQSENPEHREDLVIKTSTGVYVRTKGELALFETLCEMLSGTGVKIYYEKKLVLTVRDLRGGTVHEHQEACYPDFTIVFPDGTEIYWELCGMFELAGYRSRQYKRFCDYYDNGIYMPKNLIVTMEAKDKPLDLQAVRQIIESQILARM